MKHLKSVTDLPREQRERHLRLVRPKPKRRKRWKLPPNLRVLRKPKYGQNPALLAYEEELVLSAIREQAGTVSVASMTKRDPDRWNAPYLWRALCRLRKQGKLASSGFYLGDRMRRELTFWLAYPSRKPSDVD